MQANKQVIWALILAAAGTARASIITTPIAVNVGSGSVSGTVNTPNPNNNDTATASPNTLTVTESMTSMLFGFSFGIAPSGGSTEYFVTKTVTNNTGQTWTSFGMSVGCNAQSAFPGQPCMGFDPVTMDYQPGPGGPTGGTLASSNAYSFLWDNLSIAPGQTVTFTFSLDTCANCTGTWFLAQQAGTGVPEPKTVSMVGGGAILIGLGALRQKRRLAKA